MAGRAPRACGYQKPTSTCGRVVYDVITVRRSYLNKRLDHWSRREVLASTVTRLLRVLESALRRHRQGHSVALDTSQYPRCLGLAAQGFARIDACFRIRKDSLNNLIIGRTEILQNYGIPKKRISLERRFR